MNETSILESLLFAAGEEGLSLEQLAKALDQPADIVWQHMISMKEAWDQDETRGLQMKQHGDTFRIMTKKEAAPYIERLAGQPTPKPLSQAALETLAVIAYKQPVTRVEIEDIRGVKTERPLATLTGRGLIEEAGRADVPGRPILYKTTPYFLDAFGLTDLAALPPLAEKEDTRESRDLFFGQLEEAFHDLDES